MVEEIEALGEQFELAHLAEVEALAEAQIRLPGIGIAEGIARTGPG